MKILRSVQILLLFMLASTGVWATGAHNFHTSLTRIDFKKDDKVLEISTQLFKHDLLPLLEKKLGKRVELDQTPGIDAVIFEYLNANFVLTDKSGEVKKLVWVGMEADVESVRVFFKTDSANGPDGYSLRNTLFFESFPEQSNLVICHFNGKKADLAFKVGDKTKTITANKRESTK
ncbi:MAG: hypothetical protein KA746_04105 [Pyrinomonadaceae bacterium]|nr:hypothetical protein [Pyrinomonadaceae bacterium]MBP6211395.1 hypothetical protein [Pyrinomonadaceae bacterium]